jgi:hypothetical protein
VLCLVVYCGIWLYVQWGATIITWVGGWLCCLVSYGNCRLVPVHFAEIVPSIRRDISLECSRYFNRLSLCMMCVG